MFVFVFCKYFVCCFFYSFVSIIDHFSNNVNIMAMVISNTCVLDKMKSNKRNLMIFHCILSIISVIINIIYKNTVIDIAFEFYDCMSRKLDRSMLVSTVTFYFIGLTILVISWNILIWKTNVWMHVF